MLQNNFSISEISRQIKNNEKTIEEISSYLPCYLHTNSLTNFSLIDTDTKILKYFDKSIEEIHKEGVKLLRKVVNPIDFENAIHMNANYILNQEDQNHVAFLQRIKFKYLKDLQLYYTRGKILDTERILNLSTPI